jgi:hypothetical protein
MKMYELRKENALGNNCVARFIDVKKLIKYIDDNPLDRKYNYYMLVIETTRTRVDMKGIKQFYS